jgi:hypothetical protein
MCSILLFNLCPCPVAYSSKLSHVAVVNVRDPAINKVHTQHRKYIFNPQSLLTPSCVPISTTFLYNLTHLWATQFSSMQVPVIHFPSGALWQMHYIAQSLSICPVTHFSKSSHVTVVNVPDSAINKVHCNGTPRARVRCVTAILGARLAVERPSSRHIANLHLVLLILLAPFHPPTIQEVHFRSSIVINDFMYSDYCFPMHPHSFIIHGTWAHDLSSIVLLNNPNPCHESHYISCGLKIVARLLVL